MFHITAKTRTGAITTFRISAKDRSGAIKSARFVPGVVTVISAVRIG